MLEDGGFEEKLLQFWGGIAEDCLDEVLPQVDVRAAKGVDEFSTVLLFVQGQRGQGKAGGPTLGVADEFLQIGRSQVGCLGVLLKVADALFGGEAQVVCIQLGEQTFGAQLGE